MKNKTINYIFYLYACIFKKLWNNCVDFWGIVPHCAVFCEMSNEYDFTYGDDFSSLRFYFVSSIK